MDVARLVVIALTITVALVFYRRTTGETPGGSTARAARRAGLLPQSRLVDGCVDALPWRYWTDPAAAFCHYRDRAARRARRS
ncbi:hypothetical protein [Streptomyces sp. NPDC047014]|uniref:hypothetical protein n=1 Tax=Streptomyces sp. NPDC047014 TaxID=3155736 RepID=UPI0033EB951E